MTDPVSPALIARAQRGEPEAIGALYDMHYRAVFRYFRVRVGHQQTAEDLTGELFRRMLAGLPQYRAVGLPFRAWLFRIAHNLLVDHYRQESRQMLVSLDPSETQLLTEPDPAALIEHRLTLEEACHTLAKLDSLPRDVLTLRFLSGLSLRETALALNKTEDAVKAIQRRGLAVLRLTLAET